MSENIGYSRRKIIAGIGASVAAVCLTAPASAQFNFSFGDVTVDVGGLISGASNLFESWDLSIEDEGPIGEELYPGVKMLSGGTYQNTKMQDAIKSFADPLFSSATRTGLNWDIALVNDDTVNAWALPGGKLGINRGLLRYIDSPDELAAVIAHEMGHVEKSHHIAAMKTNRFTDGLTDIGVAALQAKSNAPVSQVLNDENVRSALLDPMWGLITSGFSREDEDEADTHIIAICDKTGHNPKTGTQFFETLLDIIPSDTSFTTSLYSTHSGTKDRIKKITALAKGNPSGGPDKGFSDLKNTFPTRNHFRHIS